MDHERLLKSLQEDSTVARSWVYKDDAELSTLIAKLHQGDFESVLKSSFAGQLLGDQQDGWSTNSKTTDTDDLVRLVSHRLDQLLGSTAEKPTASQEQNRRRDSINAFLIGYAALHAFLQANVTGPPLQFSSEQLLFQRRHHSSASPSDTEVRARLIQFLVVDGVAVYSLMPAVELFCLAKTIFNHPRLKVDGLERMRLRTNFLHQRLLSENAPALQNLIYEDLEKLAPIISNGSSEDKIEFLLERALIHLYYGYDQKARADIESAAVESRFEFVLTGRLGKRTRFQDKDISQLVVLAKSATKTDQAEEREPSTASGPDGSNGIEDKLGRGSKPKMLDLNDDTLLETISFSKDNGGATKSGEKSENVLSSNLQGIDPANQPLLYPLESLILLASALSITNTLPSDGLTREETLPYVTRVLDGGSSNWQIYTQALLLRSRIEGYRSRTQERAVFQLQALVDQIIVETTTGGSRSDEHETQNAPTSFFPSPRSGEAASAPERLRYIHQLCSPTRWELEAELAARWASLGSLKNALEVYERLQMWAEIALCYAGLENDVKARQVVKEQLFVANAVADEDVNEDTEVWRGEQRSSLPPDAPRLFCILGDLEQDPSMYDRAWEVSGRRYARAQRSLGKYYFARRDYSRSADAYENSVMVDRLNHSSWFALGSARLQLEQFDRAVECFTRAVQLEEQDAESWSNLAVALLERGPDHGVEQTTTTSREVDEQAEDEDPQHEPQTSRHSSRHKRDALNALKRAASLKHDDWRIWQNLLTVAWSTRPPSYADVVIAMQRIIEIRGGSVGEKCVDEDSLDMLVRHVVRLDAETSQPNQGSTRPGLQRMVAELVEKDIVPLITSSRRLWQIIARLFIWQRRPGLALNAYEKAWRVATSQPGWETGTEKQWNGIVEATVELVDAYESLGSMEGTNGAHADTAVTTGWRFKARNAVRGVLGRGRDSWEGSVEWDRLQERLQQLKESR
ncbi:MAG: hypothetical protein M1816_000682 [Peltula sp. TS41687]|nr:MAG: hypothetical protein M1816_000682 [Peltula sp. TS41687]